MVGESKDFRREIVENPAEYEETPLRDRKKVLYNVRDHQDKAKDKAKLVKDVIALANAARMFGKPAYLIFGIDDKGEVVGIEDSLKDFEREGHDAQDTVYNEFAEVIKGYIHPTPTWEMKFGKASKGKLCAYLLIEPHSAGPFQVQKNLPSKGEPKWGLREGECWTRVGPTNQKIPVGELASYSYADIPLVLPSTWLNYFEHLLFSEEIRSAHYLKLYEDLRTTEGSHLQDVVEDFLESTKKILVIMGKAGSGKTLFVRQLVAQLAEDGKQAMQEIRRQEEFRPPPAWIPIYFPLRNCSDADFRDATTLARTCLDAANQFKDLWEDPPRYRERLFDYSHPFFRKLYDPTSDFTLRWLICFDGLDELWKEGLQQKFISVLRSFILSNPRTKIILTTRPDILIPSDLGKVVEIAPLTEEQAIGYLEYYAGSGAQIVLDLISSHSHLQDFLTTPLYLRATTEILSGTPIESSEEIEEVENEPEMTRVNIPETSTAPSEPLPRVEARELVSDHPTEEKGELAEVQKVTLSATEDIASLTVGWLLDKVIPHIWERETKRCIYRKEKPGEWWSRLGKMALSLDGHRRVLGYEEIREYLPNEDGRGWILSLGFLVEKGGLWKFPNCMMQCYFAARHLADFLEEDDLPEDKRILFFEAEETFRRRVCQMLEEIMGTSAISELCTDQEV